MSPDKDSLRPPRGMRDFYPDDMAVRNRIFNAWRTAATTFGFSDYDACVVESLDLLKRKAGEEIVQQIYTFKDKSGRDLALRPEMTPTLARMIAARQGSLVFPVKWATIAQCFRYERTTKGRKREHYQWNLDIIGEPDMTAELEVIAAAAHALSLLQLGPDKVTILFSSRALLSALLAELGVDASHHDATFLALDKRGKMPDEEIQKMLEAAGVSPNAMTRIFELMQITSLNEALDILPSDHALRAKLSEFIQLVEVYGLSDMMQFDIGVVRGLAYYTGLVFEAVDREHKYRAIFGGGRYDNLLADVGGKPATGAGLGFGDVVIADLLADTAGQEAIAQPMLSAIGYMQEAQRNAAMRLAAAMRQDGKQVDLALHAEKAKSFFSRTGKGLHGSAVYIGPDDVAGGKARLKDLATREETEITLRRDGC